MRVSFTTAGWEDYRCWQSEDRAVLRRVNRVIDDICRDDPFTGIGKPERLRYGVDAWSRRIDGEHRLVYRVEGESLLILQARYHY
ncbi:Txe/YoeB family addiction module toxin [Demequina salsinemoris]|uniref:Txe/YoeB family addiction module toxin n=1 Tax=Demequina salsinemoris TaxID=577470 RepID=UPI0007836635|nr:Txe/YoeB family addiction module toxin [Demequina salsinemoris]